VNRLAVDPARQGEGIGRWCLETIASMGASDGVTSIRCDVLSANARLRAFYERAGYVARGTRAHSGWEFTCYERVLTVGL
jgi:ribosomal protein S18 acetylase RimI-like enzyme